MSRLNIFFLIVGLSVCFMLYPGEADKARPEPYYYLRLCTGQLCGAKRDNLSELRDRFSPEKHNGFLKECDCTSSLELASVSVSHTIPVLHLICGLCSSKGDEEAQKAFYAQDPRSCAGKIRQYKANVALAAYEAKE